MKQLTQGHLNVQPLRVKSSLSLDALPLALAERAYEGSIPTAGWGGVSLDSEPSSGEAINRRSSPGDPRSIGIKEIVEAEEQGAPKPAVVAAYLQDRLDRSLRRRLSDQVLEGLSAEQRYRLEGVELAIMDSPFADDEHVAYVAAHMEPDVRAVRDELQWTLESVDERAAVDIGYRAYAPDPDLFLWLLHKQNHSAGVLGEGLVLQELERVHVQDQNRDRALVLDLATLDRDVVCLYVQDIHSEFGPGRLRIVDHEIGVELYWEYELNGAFTIFVGESEFQDGTALNTPTGRLRVVRDVGHRLIPKLLRLHAADASAWPPHRQQMRQDARDHLLQLLQASGP